MFLTFLLLAWWDMSSVVEGGLFSNADFFLREGLIGFYVRLGLLFTAVYVFVVILVSKNGVE